MISMLACDDNAVSHPRVSGASSDGSPRDAAPGTAPPADANLPSAGSAAAEHTATIDSARGFVFSSVRCGQCHAATEKQWASGAHSVASSTPLYLAMRAHGSEGCERCHEPMQAITNDARIAKEGVTCLVCHRIDKVEVQKTSSMFSPQFDDNVMFGPLCDARNQYFHKMGCSPLHAKSQFCGACHHLLLTTPSGVDLPVFTEYQEWLASPYAARGVDCQECHMPGRPRHVAVGSRMRPNVHDHGLNDNAQQVAGAITVSVTISSSPEQLLVTSVVDNLKVGHHAPSGLPGHELVLRLRILNEADLHEEDRAERLYSRVLVDDHGNEVPFYAARRVKSDTRLKAQEKRRETFAWTTKAGGRLVAELFSRPISPALATALGLPEPREQILVKAEISFKRTSSNGQRPGLPVTMLAEPVN
ncbi:MAG: uncharacterized protein JWO36_6970 [Myxococcales bacterium]|nr:uncharacterized protein [Myxococcales bacterium]